MKTKDRSTVIEEKLAPAANGMLMLLLFGGLYAASAIAILAGFITLGEDAFKASSWIGASLIYLCLGWIPLMGLKVLRPNEAYVLTLFGAYYGSLRGPGFFWVNPFVGALNPCNESASAPASTESGERGKHATAAAAAAAAAKIKKQISLKTLTLSNDRQKINDKLGNPIVIGIVVIWRVTNTARAAFNVDNYAEFLSIQCDSALRNIVRLYPYDSTDEEGLCEKSLRGSSIEIAAHLREEIQSKVEIAGLEIAEARITHLAYAPEIAAAMLQRQQAKAIIDARAMIVEGAVGMVESALARLSEKQVVELDEERKAAMVSNLLVVLCANKEAQPIVNSGSLY